MKITLPILNEFLEKNNIPEWELNDELLSDIKFIETFHNLPISSDLSQLIIFIHELGYDLLNYEYQLQCPSLVNRDSLFNHPGNELMPIGVVVDDVLWNYDRVHEEYSEECPFDLGAILFDVYGDGHEIIYINDRGEFRGYNYELDESESNTTLYAMDQTDFINKLILVKDE